MFGFWFWTVVACIVTIVTLPKSASKVTKVLTWIAAFIPGVNWVTAVIYGMIYVLEGPIDHRVY